MEKEKMVFEVESSVLRIAQNAFNSAVLKSKGAFAEGLSPYQIEIHTQEKRVYGLLVFWRENFANYIFCEVHIFNAEKTNRYRATCFLYRKDCVNIKSFVNALNAKIGRFCMLQNILFVEKR